MLICLCLTLLQFTTKTIVFDSLSHSSRLGGGGGGSGGAVSFSACTLTAGSSAKIETKGGDGGQARGEGERLDYVFHLFGHACLISHSNPISQMNDTPLTLLTQDMAVEVVAVVSLPTRQQLSIMMTA